MPSQGDNNSSEGEQRTGLQPTELPPDAKPTTPLTSRWITFLVKMGITARLMGNEIYRNKLKWFDLRRADYRLGRKAYEVASSLPGQSRTIDRLKRIHDRLEALSRPINCGPSFKDKLKAAVKGMLRAMKIQILKFRRKRAFRKLGHHVAVEQVADDALAPETGEVKAVSEKLRSVNAEIQTLSAQTYLWAGRPLLTSSIALGLLTLFSAVAYEQEGTNRNQSGQRANSSAQAPPSPASRTSGAESKARVEEFVKRGFDKFDNGDYQGAIAEYTRAIELDPTNAALYNYRANAKFGAKNLDGAMADCDRAIELDPVYSGTYYTRGRLKYARGDSQGGRADQIRGGELEAAKKSLESSTATDTGAQSKTAAKDEPIKPTTGDAKTWANNYRNAKFITRAEFLRNVGPVHLAVRQRSGVSQNVRNLEDIVRTSAAAHGWRFTSDPGVVQMVVDADLERAKMTTTEYTNFGPVESGYHMTYAAAVQVGFMIKANCLRGDKFVELSVYPSRSWNIYYGYMGDLDNFEATYAKAFRQALDGAFDAIAALNDSDDEDDVASWNASLWPASRDAEMYKNFIAPVTGEPGTPGRTFYGITKFDLANIELLDGAQGDFNAGRLQQDWMSELTVNEHEVDASSNIRIQHQFRASKIAGGVFGDGPAYYFHQNAIRVWQENVVFPFRGELRRGKACIWSDLECAIALPREYGNVGRDLLNRSIRSAAKEFALRR